MALEDQSELPEIVLQPISSYQENMMTNGGAGGILADLRTVSVLEETVRVEL